MSIEKRVHPIPFRTRKLSASSPMILRIFTWESRPMPRLSLERLLFRSLSSFKALRAAHPCAACGAFLFSLSRFEEIVPGSCACGTAAAYVHVRFFCVAETPYGRMKAERGLAWGIAGEVRPFWGLLRCFWPRMCGDRYALRAGRNLPDRDFAAFRLPGISSPGRGMFMRGEERGMLHTVSLREPVLS